MGVRAQCESDADSTFETFPGAAPAAAFSLSAGSGAPSGGDAAQSAAADDDVNEEPSKRESGSDAMARPGRCSLHVSRPSCRAELGERRGRPLAAIRRAEVR